LIKINQIQDLYFNLSNKTKNLNRNNYYYFTENKTAMTQKDEDSNTFNEGSKEDQYANSFYFNWLWILLLNLEI